MATKIIELTEGIEFASFYYPELLETLLSFLRNNRDRLGLTDENDFEVHVQLLRAFALIGHLNNTKLDTVATELFPDSARLLESLKQLFRLMGVELSSASPATATLVARLTESTSIDTVAFIPALAEFTTESIPPLVFEASDQGEDLDATINWKHVFALENQGTSNAGSVDFNANDIFTDLTVVFPADVVGDLIYIPATDTSLNEGLFRVVERLTDTSVRVVLEPDGAGANFSTETGITWYRLRYSSDFATVAVSSNPADNFSPFASAPYIYDALYLCHRHIMPTEIDMTFATNGDSFTGVWEYYDNERSEFTPITVSFSSPDLTFDLQSLLGSDDRSGAQVTIKYLKTGKTHTVTSTYSGGKNIAKTTSLFGQTNPSVDPEDYSITSLWVPFDNLKDNTVAANNSWGQNGTVSWDLPQTFDRSWIKSKLNNASLGYWFRFRVVTANLVGTNPVVDTILNTGDSYVAFDVLQGETAGDLVFGSSSGQPNQKFKLPDTPFIDNSETISVDEGGVGGFVEYTRVSSFLESNATSKHYIVRTTAKGEAEIIFGDGQRGKIPPIGVSNLKAKYRIGGGENGNVGVDQIVVNADGVGGLADIHNPRSATGWRIKEGGDDLDFKRIKIDKPLEIAIRGVVVRPADAEYLAVHKFVDSKGIKPVSRAFAIEEGFGIKTIKLLVVGVGGSSLTVTQLQDLNLYLNGDRNAVPPVVGVAPANTKIIPVNFEPTPISIETTVVWHNGSADAIRNKLIAFLTPDAVLSDGSTFAWNFGGQISYSRVHSLIHNVSPNIRDVQILKLAKGSNTLAAASVSLGQNELPITNSTLITVTILEP